eukprot:tig00000180_g13618.t1
MPTTLSKPPSPSTCATRESLGDVTASSYRVGLASRTPWTALSIVKSFPRMTSTGPKTGSPLAASRESWKSEKAKDPRRHTEDADGAPSRAQKSPALAESLQNLNLASAPKIVQNLLAEIRSKFPTPDGSPADLDQIHSALCTSRLYCQQLPAGALKPIPLDDPYWDSPENALRSIVANWIFHAEGTIRRHEEYENARLAEAAARNQQHAQQQQQQQLQQQLQQQQQQQQQLNQNADPAAEERRRALEAAALAAENDLTDEELGAARRLQFRAEIDAEQLLQIADSPVDANSPEGRAEAEKLLNAALGDLALLREAPADYRSIGRTGERLMLRVGFTSREAQRAFCSAKLPCFLLDAATETYLARRPFYKEERMDDEDVKNRTFQALDIPLDARTNEIIDGLEELMKEILGDSAAEVYDEHPTLLGDLKIDYVQKKQRIADNNAKRAVFTVPPAPKLIAALPRLHSWVKLRTLISGLAKLLASLEVDRVVWYSKAIPETGAGRTVGTADVQRWQESHSAFDPDPLLAWTAFSRVPFVHLVFRTADALAATKQIYLGPAADPMHDDEDDIPPSEAYPARHGRKFAGRYIVVPFERYMCPDCAAPEALDTLAGLLKEGRALDDVSHSPPERDGDRKCKPRHDERRKAIADAREADRRQREEQRRQAQSGATKQRLEERQRRAEAQREQAAEAAATSQEKRSAQTAAATSSGSKLGTSLLGRKAGRAAADALAFNGRASWATWTPGAETHQYRLEETRDCATLGSRHPSPTPAPERRQDRPTCPRTHLLSVDLHPLAIPP